MDDSKHSTKTMTSVSSIQSQLQTLEKKVEKLTAMSFIACLIFIIVFIFIGNLHYTIQDSKTDMAVDMLKLRLTMETIEHNHSKLLTTIENQNLLIKELLKDARAENGESK